MPPLPGQPKTAEKDLFPHAAHRGQDADRRPGDCLAALHEVSQQLAAATSVDDLCRQAVELGQRRLGVDRLALWFRTEDPGMLQGSFGSGGTGL
jgi:hypothetical protein